MFKPPTVKLIGRASYSSNKIEHCRLRVQFDNYANFAEIEHRWCYTLIKLNTELNIRLVLNKEEAMDQNTFAARLAAAMDSAGFKQADLVHAAGAGGAFGNHLPCPKPTRILPAAR